MKEMKPNEEKLVETMAETRLGLEWERDCAWAAQTHDGGLGKGMHGGVGKGLRGQHRHMMEGWGRGCMAAEREERRGGCEARAEEGQVAARRIDDEKEVLSDVCLALIMCIGPASTNTATRQRTMCARHPLS